MNGNGAKSRGGEGREWKGKERSGEERAGENRLCNRGTPHSHNPMVQQKRFICKSTFLSIDARLFISKKLEDTEKKYYRESIM